MLYGTVTVAVQDRDLATVLAQQGDQGGADAAGSTGHDVPAHGEGVPLEGVVAHERTNPR